MGRELPSPRHRTGFHCPCAASVPHTCIVPSERAGHRDVMQRRMDSSDVGFFRGGSNDVRCDAKRCGLRVPNRSVYRSAIPSHAFRTLLVHSIPFLRTSRRALSPLDPCLSSSFIQTSWFLFSSHLPARVRAHVFRSSFPCLFHIHLRVHAPPLPLLVQPRRVPRTSGGASTLPSSQNCTCQPPSGGPPPLGRRSTHHVPPQRHAYHENQRDTWRTERCNKRGGERVESRVEMNNMCGEEGGSRKRSER